jgi:hypothetical protein
MTTSRVARSAAATALAITATLARAGGDSGTGSMGEMQLSGGHFLMILGGMAGLGVVVWAVAKFAGK